MERHTTYMNAVKRTDIPDAVMFIDTETSQGKETDRGVEQNFVLGVACFQVMNPIKGGDLCRWFEAEEEEWLNRWILNRINKPKKSIITASNINFDVRVIGLIEYLCKNKWQVKGVYHSGFTFIVRIAKGKHSCTLMNLQNILPFSIGKLGKMLGYEKTEATAEHSTTEELMTYCRRDVEILRRSFNIYRDFVRNHRLGAFKATLASQAFTGFRHRFMSDRIHIHCDSQALKLERSSYFGGRVEALRIGKLPEEQYYYLDINSMYPYVMSSQVFPVKLSEVSRTLPIADLTETMKHFSCIADVVISTPTPMYPKKVNKRLCFPIGRFHTTLCTASLKMAIENNHLVSVGRVATYHHNPIFVNYVKYFHDLKGEYERNKDTAFRQVTKLFLNTLYGKFGQRSQHVVSEEETEDVGFSIDRMFDMGSQTWFTVKKDWNLVVTTNEDIEETTLSFPGIAAHVTDYARCLLWEFMTIAGVENVYYTDTDSLIVNDNGYRNLTRNIEPGILGKLNLEKQSNILEIRGLKDYTFGEESKTKGIPKTAVQTGPDDFKVTIFPTYLTGRREGMELPYCVQTRSKHLTREYHKGQVNKETGTVTPFVLMEQ